MKTIEKGMEIMKKNLAKFLLLSSSSSSNSSDSSKSVVGRLLPKTGQETGVVLATLGLLSLVGIAIVSLRKKF